MNKIIGVLAAVAAAIGGSVADAQTRGSETLVTDPAQVERILGALDEGVWVADGAAADRHVYVIYSTACGFSKKLFTDTRAMPNRPQFRWLTVAAEGYGAEGVVSQRTPASIAGAFANQYAKPADPAAAARAIELNAALMFVMPNTAQIVYPTLIHKTKQGLNIHYGVPANLQKLNATVHPRPEQANHEPAGLRWVTAPASLTTAAKLKTYTGADEKGTPVRLAPDIGAPVIKEIEKGYFFPVDGIANDEWARIVFAQVGGEPVHGYVHAPREIKLASLKYTVRPAGGVLNTGDRTLEIREQPSLDANVLERVEPGYQLTRTGELELDGRKWTEVRVYTDGTKGYIAE